MAHFSEEKMFHKIGEVSNYLNLPASQLRFWEREFEELQPKKNAKGERLYSKRDIETLEVIQHLVKEKGYTLPGAKEAMKSKNDIHSKLKAIHKLNEIKAFLQDVKKKL